MIFACIFAVFHLTLLFTEGSTMAPDVVLRGVCANFLIGWVLSKIITLTDRPRLRLSMFGLATVALALSHSHVAINGSYPDINYVGIAMDRVFILSVLTDQAILWRILFYTAITITILIWTEKRNVGARISKGSRTALLSISIITYALASISPACEVGRWEACNLLDYNLFSIVSKTNGHKQAVQIDGRRLIPKEDGKRLYTSPGANVIVVMIEGLSQHFVTHGYTPELKEMAKNGLKCLFFLNHQRQTNRGLYSSLCGAYPNLAMPETKSDLMALGGIIQNCLPQYLKQNGYHTAFLQSADLGYMSKDLFAEKAGFVESRGFESVKDPIYSGPWGVDDLSLYKSAITYIKEIKQTPYFLTLLTSSTHPPFKTQHQSGNKKNAFEYASRSIEWFYNSLKAMGELENTILIITSDESSANTLKDLKDPIAHLRGFLLVLGNRIRPGINPGTYGQVDMAFSILDYLQIDPQGFGGRSFFQLYNSPRTLYAANSFSKTLYALSNKDLVELNRSFQCYKYINYLDAAPEEFTNLIKMKIDKDTPEVIDLLKIAQKNDMNTQTLSGPLVTLPKRVYGGEPSHQLIGRYVSTLPEGESLEVSIEISNPSDNNDMYLDWFAYDCTGKNSKAVRKIWDLPSGSAPLKAHFLVKQQHKNLCHTAWVKSKDGQNTAPWELTRFSVSNKISE